MNPEATKHELDKWSEDLLIRIQLRFMHPHTVIHQNGSAADEENRALEADK